MATSFPAGREPYVGVEVPAVEARALLGSVAGWLDPTESTLALVRTVKALPSLTHVVVTNLRIAGFNASELAQQGLVVQALFSVVRSVETRKSYQQRSFLMVIDDSGNEIDFGDVHGQDEPEVLQIARNGIAASSAATSPPPTPTAPQPVTPGLVAAPFPPAPERVEKPVGWRYNPPPTWPPPPPGWTPQPGWQPDPSWPAPPPGWSLWVPQIPPAVQLASTPDQTHALPAPDTLEAAAPPVPPSPRDDLQAAAARANVKTGSREVRSLAAHLVASDEQILHVASGQYRAGNGLVALTDQRLLFIQEGLIRKAIEEFPINKITTVQWKDGRLLGKLTVFIAGSQVEITTASKPCGKAIAEAIQEKLASRQYQPPSSILQPGQGPGQQPSVTASEAAARRHDPGTGTGRSVSPPVWPVVNPPATTPARLPQLAAAPAWLPGDVEIEVMGEAYRRESVDAAAADAEEDGALTAVLIPEPPSSKYPDAVAVYLQTHLVGYLAKEVCGQVHRAVLSFAASHAGQLPSCPAEIYQNVGGQQVLLLLDPRPLGLPPALLAHVPEMAKAVQGLIGQLDQAPTPLHGRDDAARQALADAKVECTAASDTWSGDRPANTWPRLERTVKGIIHKMERAADPQVADAWLILAGCTRFQKGKRDETLTAYIQCLRCDPANVDAWQELFEYVCSAPYVPMLLDLYERVPLSARPAIARHLLAVSYGNDRHGNLSAHAGMRLRTGLKNLALSQQDQGTVAVLAADVGRRAEKAGDHDAAIAAYREAVTAGSNDHKVADRLSVWLVKQGLYAEAAAVLAQALQQPPETASTRERLEKRLQRCQRALA